MNNTAPYLSNLTALRGIAALWVTLYHFDLAMDNIGLPYFVHLVRRGYLMVDLFFIMSGFIIMYVYGEGFRHAAKNPLLWRYVTARFARLYPLHLFTLILLIAARWASGDWRELGGPATIPAHVLLLQSFGLQKELTWNGPSWSLSAEWYLSMLFPWMALFYHKNRKTALLALLLIMTASYLFLLSRSGPITITNPSQWLRYTMDITINYGFLRGIGGFVLGILVYGFYSNRRARRFFSRNIVTGFAILITLICLYKNLGDVLSVLIFSALVLAFAANKSILHTVCSFKPLQFLGKISYSIYLIQIIVIHYFLIGLRSTAAITGFPFPETFPLFDRFLYQAGFLLLLTGCATITYYGVEKPCRNFLYRMAKPSSPSIASAT